MSDFMLDRGRHLKSFSLDLGLDLKVEEEDATSITQEEDSSSSLHTLTVKSDQERKGNDTDLEELGQSESTLAVAKLREAVSLSFDEDEDESEEDTSSSLFHLQSHNDSLSSFRFWQNDDGTTSDEADATSSSLHRLQRHRDSISDIRFCQDDLDVDVVNRNGSSLPIQTKPLEQEITEATVASTEFDGPASTSTVRFGAVTVYYHSHTLGECAFCLSGPPIALGDRVQGQGAEEVLENVEAYQTRYPRYLGVCPRLSATQRRTILKREGFSHLQVKQRALQMQEDRARIEKDVNKYRKQQQRKNRRNKKPDRQEGEDTRRRWCIRQLLPKRHSIS